MRPLPENVYAYIFKFINPCGSLHFLYIRDLYIRRCHNQLPPPLHISALISMNDTRTLEKLKHLVLNFEFRETVKLAVAQFGSIETIQWFLSNGIISWDTYTLILLASRGELFAIKLLLSQGSRFSPQIIFNFCYNLFDDKSSIIDQIRTTILRWLYTNNIAIYF